MSTLDRLDEELRRRALDVLCSAELERMVEMVVYSPGPDRYVAQAVDGTVRFRRRRRGGDWVFDVDEVTGRDPLGDQDPTRFSPLPAETAALHPSRSANSYPLAFERVSQIFDHPCAPDLCVLHTAAHHPSTLLGEHGSLGVVQSRAPFIISGAGAARRGLVDGHCRLVDVAPTVLALLGARPQAGTGPTGDTSDGLYLRRQDGRVLTELLDGGRPDHVVVVLADGANANVVYDAAERGDAPNLAGLIERGTALRHGAVASLPTVTLANHTTLLTGAHPGHHGVLHNAWYDRSLSRQVVTESPATWQGAMQWLFDGVETIHEALHRHRPGSLCLSVNEPADRGADYSTFELFRRGEVDRLIAGIPNPLPHTAHRWLDNEHYRFGSGADASGLAQALALWSGEHLGTAYGLPDFCWVSFSVTDAAMHEGGPHSAMARDGVRDTDARLGSLLAAVAERGVLDRTAVLVVADHGMEQNDPGCTGTWGDALRAAGVAHRDEASGFVYLGELADTPDPDSLRETPAMPDLR